MQRSPHAMATAVLGLLFGGAWACGGSDPAASCPPATHACVDTVPAGWTGPVALYLGSTPAPACPTAFPGTTLQETAFAEPVYTPATCSACTCGPATGEACAGPTPSGGSCPASGGAPTMDAPLTDVTKACGDAGVTGECAGAQRCLQRPPAPFASSACVFQLGDLPCPGGTWAVKHTTWNATLDSRSCTPCGCGAPAGGTCPGSVPTGSTCAPTGGAPVGSVAPTGPTTYCCGE